LKVEVIITATSRSVNQFLHVSAFLCGSINSSIRLTPPVSSVDRQGKVYEYGEIICIAPRVAEPIDAALGILPSAPSLADELRQERQKDEQR